MLKLKTKKVKYVEIKGYVVTIEKNPSKIFEDGVYEFFINYKDYGTKMYMFGIPGKYVVSDDDLLDYVAGNVEQYILIYEKENMDCEE